MMDREKSPMKPLTSDRAIQSSQYVSLSENHNPNLGHINRVTNCSGKSKTSAGITEPKTPNKSLVRTGKDEAQQVVTSESKVSGIAAPSPPRRHFCRSPRCASNNPDYAQPASIPLRKFLVSKRHLLLQAKGEIPPPGPISPAAAAATLPHDHISATPLPPAAAISGCMKETAGAEVEDTEGNLGCRLSEEQCEFAEVGDTKGNLGCRLSEEQCEFEQSQVMESVMQDDDICPHVKQVGDTEGDLGCRLSEEQCEFVEVGDTKGNLGCRLSEDQCEFEQSQVMESVMKQDDDICPIVKQVGDTQGNLDYRLCEEQCEFAEVGNIKGNLGCSLFEEQCEFEQSQVMESVMKQDDDICPHVKQVRDTEENLGCRLSEEQCEFEQSQVMESVMKQDEDICSNVEQDDDTCSQQDDDMCPQQDDDICFAAEEEEEKEKDQSENNVINMSMHTCSSSDPVESSSKCSNTGVFETPCLVNHTVEECELPTESPASGELVAMTTSGKCKDSIWTSSCIEAVAPVDATAQQHETAAVRTQAILEKKQIRGCRINNAIAEAHRKVSEPLGEGRVRHLVEAFENIISLAESEAEESRVIKSQGFEKAHHTNPGRGLQASPAAEDHHVCEQSIACSSANLHEEAKLPAVPVKTMVDMYHSSKQSPIKPMTTVKPLDENRRILQFAESDHILGDKHSIETCLQATTELTVGYDQLEKNIIFKEELDASTVEVKRMIERYNVEMTSLAHARSIDKVRNWNNGESMHANAGYELWKKLLNSPNVVDRGYLIAHERIGMADGGRVSLVKPMAVDSEDATNKHDQGASTDESKLGSVACKGEINKEACTIPTRDYLGNEVDQASNFGVSVCNSFQSQRTGTSFGMHSRKSKSTCLQPFALRTEARGARKKHEFARKLARMFAEEQRMRIPLAQGLPWTTDEPQALPKPPVKESTVPLEIHLFSDIRACERAEFDEYVAERISLMEQQRQEREKLKQIAEQEEIKRMRREMVPRAQLMPYFDRPFMPKRSSKRLTIPKGPSFQWNQNKRHKCMVTQG